MGAVAFYRLQLGGQTMAEPRAVTMVPPEELAPIQRRKFERYREMLRYGPCAPAAPPDPACGHARPRAC